MNLENLFNPKSIAIVGASEEEGKVGNVIAKNILNLGYVGKVFLINPNHEEILGRKCYSRISDISEPLDLAIIAIPAVAVNAVISESANKVKNFVIISAGFSEIGKEGKKREEELLRMAKGKNLNILGPNCLGFIIPELKLNASFAGGMPEPGNIAFVSQSGALAVGMMDAAKKEGIKFSMVISVGNKTQISEIELLKFLGEDQKTKVIGLYLEGIARGPEFVKVAREVSSKKPVVVIKAGKTERAQRAISSHTGALAGSDEIISAVFEKAGVIKAENLEEFFDLVDLISNTLPPKNKEVVVITNAGGPGVLTTDAFSEKEMALAELNEKQKNNLKKFLPPESSVENPIDLLGDAREDRYVKALKVIEKADNIGSVLLVLTPQDQTPVDKIARKIINFKKKTEKTMAAVFIGGDRIKRAVKKLEDNNIPNFSFPDRAVKTLDKYYRWNVRRSDEAARSFASNKERKNKVLEIINKAKNENRSALYFSEASEVMKIYGVNTVEYVEIFPKAKPWDSEGLALGIDFPVVLKIDSERVLHKTDRKALVLDVKNSQQLDLEIKKMNSNFPNERLIVQPMEPKGAELIVGIEKDEVFGPIVMYGLGGIYTEVLRMVDFLAPPLSTEEIKKALLKSKIRFLFRETRRQAPHNSGELADIILGISQFALEIPEIREFDINPLLIYNDGKETVAVDVKIII